MCWLNDSSHAVWYCRCSFKITVKRTRKVRDIITEKKWTRCQFNVVAAGVEVSHIKIVFSQRGDREGELKIKARAQSYLFQSTWPLGWVWKTHLFCGSYRKKSTLSPVDIKHSHMQVQAWITLSMVRVFKIPEVVLQNLNYFQEKSRRIFISVKSMLFSLPPSCPEIFGKSFCVQSHASNTVSSLTPLTQCPVSR